MLKDFLSRLEQNRLYRQLRTLWRVATGAAGSRNDEALDLFLLGSHTIPRISALLNPGLGGPPLLDKQREIEGSIRLYTLGLEKTIEELHQQLADLQRAQLEQAAQAAKDAQPAPAAAPVAAPDLLAGLLGI